uniref:LRRCT domain-containing protein n=1 Tax=Glossina brevipalpis TaxID=37001 RepID=A0A1A9W9I4_9MUSC
MINKRRNFLHNSIHSICGFNMEMNHVTLLFVLTTLMNLLLQCVGQHENIPYENVENICKTCICQQVRQDTGNNKQFYDILNCTKKGFKHILARWPIQFGNGTKGDHIIILATFSGNTIDVLQQLPSTNATLHFTCRHCNIKHLQAPTFLDVPNINTLDLAWNEIESDELVPDVFRGPYHTTNYEPIALYELDLSHNRLQSLDRRIFEHTPNITRLNLSFNPYKILDISTSVALASATLLQSLDLSYTGIKTIPKLIFENLTSLKYLNLEGNEFIYLPESFYLIGRSLQYLNLARNLFSHFNEQSFLGLKVLTQLNISFMPALKSIESNTFSRLETLTYLECSHNPNLIKFDLDSLMHCGNLTFLDLSFCNLNGLSFNMDFPSLESNNKKYEFSPKPWIKLKMFNIKGNQWVCDCELFETLEYIIGNDYQDFIDQDVRCESPYLLSGARLSNLTSIQICALQIPKKYRVVDEDPPRFRRKRYVILTVVTATIVVILGLIIGFIVVCIRRRLKRDDFGVEPIRYTSVRSSNLSAFLHVHVDANNGI